MPLCSKQGMDMADCPNPGEETTQAANHDTKKEQLHPPYSAPIS